jgi:hypothetical protein
MANDTKKCLEKSKEVAIGSWKIMLTWYVCGQDPKCKFGDEVLNLRKAGMS